VLKRLDENPQAMRQRRETVEHPLARSRPALAYNLTRVLNIVGVKPLIAAMRA
jgi:hypothetical protein